MEHARSHTLAESKPGDGLKRVIPPRPPLLRPEPLVESNVDRRNDAAEAAARASRPPANTFAPMHSSEAALLRLNAEAGTNPNATHPPRNRSIRARQQGANSTGTRTNLTTNEALAAALGVEL